MTKCASQELFPFKFMLRIKAPAVKADGAVLVPA